DKLIKEVEKKRLAFENDESKAPSSRDTKRWNALLKEDDTSLNSLSSGRQSIRRRARHLATGILQKLGPEVLLLVVSLQDSDKMARLDKQKFVRELQLWWNSVSHPRALTAVAKECFAMHVHDTTMPSALQMPTDVVPTEQDASSAFETAIMLAAQSIPGPKDRDAWTTTALSHLYLLKRLSCTVDDERVSVKVAIMADLEQMEKYIGDYLYRGVEASRMRDGEDSKLTRALRLGLASDSGEDFILEIWVCSSYGMSIVDKMRTMTSVEDWKDILGDYLYMAMKSSKSRKIEEDTEMLRTSAVRIISPNGNNYDSKIEVMMSFDTGREVW
ncbi:hypothetical protein DM02DRAFT_478757, partial [Periconia macrospinosa]